MFTYQLRGVDNSVIDLNDIDSLVKLRGDGLMDLLPTVTHNRVTIPGRAGGVWRNATIAPIEGTLPLLVKTPAAFRNFRYAFDTRVNNPQPSYLVLIGHERGELELPIRLSRGFPPPAQTFDEHSGLLLDLEFYSDSGLWFRTDSRTGNNVTVTNWGDVPVYPTLTWWGGSGTLTLPSGAQITMPSTSAPLSVSLDPLQSMRVTNSAGVFQPTPTSALRAHPPGEPVPAGEEARYQFSTTRCRFDWRIGVVSPWS